MLDPVTLSMLVSGGMGLAGSWLDAQSQEKYANEQQRAANAAQSRLDGISSQVRSDVGGTIGTGQAANSALASLMGLDVSSSPAARAAASAPDYAAFLKQNPDIAQEYARQLGLKGGKGRQLLERDGVFSAEDFAKKYYQQYWADRAMPTVGDSMRAAQPASPPAATSPPPPTVMVDPATGQMRMGGDVQPRAEMAPGASQTGAPTSAGSSALEALMGIPGVATLIGAGNMPLAAEGDRALYDEAQARLKGAADMDLSVTADTGLRDEALGYYRRGGEIDLDGEPLTYEQLTQLPGWDAMMRASNDQVVQSAYATGKTGGGVLAELADRGRRDAYSVYDTEMDRRLRTNLSMLEQTMGVGDSLYGAYEGDYDRSRTAKTDAYNQKREGALDLYGLYTGERAWDYQTATDAYGQRRQQGMDALGVYGSQVDTLMSLMNGGSGTSLNWGGLASGNTSAAAQLQQGVPNGGNPWANLLMGGASFLSSSGGQDMLGGINEWWKNRNSPKK